jgi:anti-sigma factor RsiW
MNCAQVRAALPEFVYGGLTPEVQGHVESHINGCPECRRESVVLRQVRHLLTAAPALEVRVDAPALYRMAAERQARRTRTWRRFALTACAAVFALIAVTALARLEIHVGSSEMVVRWGPVPEPTPNQGWLYAPRSPVAPLVAAPPRDLSSIEDRLRVLSELTQALAEDDRDRDQQREREIAHLRRQIKDWQGQSAQRFGAVERDFDALYTAQFPSRKGGRP